MSNNFFKTITYLLVAIVFFGVGFLVRSLILNDDGIEYSKPGQSELESAYQRGQADAWQKLKDSSYLSDAELGSVYSLSGKVSAVNAPNSFTLTIKPLHLLADSALNNRKITLAKDAKIYQITKKDETSYQAELIVFMQQSGAIIEEAPGRYEKKEVNFNVLKIDQNVNVVAFDQDVSEQQQFNVKEVTINYYEEK